MFQTGIAMILAAGLCFVSGERLLATTFQTVDYGNSTVLTGTDGNRVVGYAGTGSGPPTDNLYYGFVQPLDGGSLTKLPRVNVGNESPFAVGISGNLVYGAFAILGPDTSPADGFVFDLSTHAYQTVSDTYNNSRVVGISGSVIVGRDGERDQAVGFRYDGTSYTHFSAPAGFGTGTIVCGVSGDEMVGYGLSLNGYVGTWYPFLFDGANWNHLVDPNSPYVEPMAISGNLITGIFYDSTGQQRGFLFDGTTWTVIDYRLRRG